MKKLIYILFLSIVIVPFGCDDFLEEELFSDLGGNSFPADMAHAETMINEAYARSVHAFVTHHRLGWAVEFPSPSTQLWNRRPHERQNLQTWSWSNTYTDPSYYDLLDRIWAVVRSSNDVIGLLPEIELDDEVRKEEIIGEAYFLRGLCYFHMVRLWGGMPIIDKAQTLKDDLYPKRATVAETYDFIINDFQTAASKLRSRTDQVAAGVNPGHANKDAALGMLAKVYLTMAGEAVNDPSHLQDAKTVLEEVMTSDHGLMPDYESIYDWKNNNNAEILFSWQLEGNEQSSYALFYFMPNDHDGTLWMPPGQQGIEYDLVPPEFVDWYAARDSGPRFEYTIITEYTNRDGVLRVYNGGPNEAAHVGKYRYADYPVSNNCCSSPTDVPVLRYADILLMYAEVLNELEGPANAFQYVNQIRDRAELTPLSGLSQDELRDAIFEERMLELTYEMDMLYDMRRRGYAYTKNLMEGFYKADQNNYPNGDAYANLTVEEHEMLFPYPVNDLIANPNLVGNPGYNQGSNE